MTKSHTPTKRIAK